MDKTIVYVVTNTESGWDCVCGVFYTKEKALDYIEEKTGARDEYNTIFIIHDKYIK